MSGLNSNPTIVEETDNYDDNLPDYLGLKSTDIEINEDDIDSINKEEIFDLIKDINDQNIH